MLLLAAFGLIERRAIFQRGAIGFPLEWIFQIGLPPMQPEPKTREKVCGKQKYAPPLVLTNMRSLVRSASVQAVRIPR